MKKFTLIAFLFSLTSLNVPLAHAQLSPGDILVLETDVGGSGGRLSVVDPATGDRFSFDLLGSARDIAVESSGNILVIDRFFGPSDSLNVLYRYSISPRATTIVSDFDNVLQGPVGAFPRALAVEPSGDILFLDGGAGSNGQGALFRVNPTTGFRTILSDFGNPAQGPLGDLVQEVAVDASGNIVVVEGAPGTTNPGAVLRINPVTGFRTLLSDFDDPSQGPQLDAFAPDVDFGASCNILVEGGSSLVSVHPNTGFRTVLNDFGIVDGIAVEGSGDILVMDRPVLRRVDATSGNWTSLSNFTSSSQGPGGEFFDDVAVVPGLGSPSCISPGLYQFQYPVPASVAFDGVDTLYFTALDPDLFIPVDCNNPPPNDTCNDNFAGRIWSIKTDGTGLSTVANLPGGVPRFGGVAPRNILALAYDSSRNGLWLSVSPVNDLNFFDLDAGEFAAQSVPSSAGFDLPGEAAGAWNAPNGLAYDPVDDRLFFSAAAGTGGEGETIFQVTAQTLFATAGASLGQITEFSLNSLPGGNDGMAWDGEKLWLAREGSFGSSGFIGTFNPDPLLITEREGGPTFSDAGSPNGLAFDGVTFAPSCVLWATSRDGSATLRAYDTTCPTGEATDNTPPTVICGDPTPPGSLEITFQDLESGLADISLLGANPDINSNVDIIIPTFVEGTRSLVTVTANRIDHNDPDDVLIALRGVDVQGIPSNAGCTIPAGVIPPLSGGLQAGYDGTVREGSGLMWLQDASYAYTSGYDADGKMTWHEAMTWANDLIFAGYADWRLPTTLVPDPSCGDFGPDYIEGFCSGSEMGHLYYESLGNTPGFGGFTNSGPFINIGEDGDPAFNYSFYWSSTEINSNNAHHFLFYDGFTNPSGNDKSSQLYFAWAVRDILPTDTPTGPDVEVTPTPGVSVTFGDVSSGGATTVDVSAANPGSGATGFGFEFFGSFYDINTLANYSDTPGAENVEICLTYNEADLPAGTTEGDIVVKRWNGTSWEDPITSTIDTTFNIACGTFSELSWFGIAVKIDFVLPGDLDVDGDVDRNDLDIVLGYRNQDASNCPECDIDGDGAVTVLDARTLVTMCTRPRCATE